MNKAKKITKALLAILISGLISLPFTLIFPSEEESVFWMGASKERLFIFTFHLLAVLLTAMVLVVGSKNNYSLSVFQSVARVLTHPAHYTVLRNLMLGLSIFLSFVFVYVSISIPQALSSFSAWLVLMAWTCYGLFLKLVPVPIQYLPTGFRSLFPSWKKLTPSQKRTALVLLGFGLLYFCLFIPLNLRLSGSLDELNLDEKVMYPVIVKMVSNQPNLHQALYRFVNYGAYIYGFPYFGWSAILLLPSKIFFNQSYADHLQLNMLLLRQFVNVLPTLMACYLITYLTTHFKKLWASLLVFILVLTLPGVVGINKTFWHPDGLNLLFIALTLFYLDRDQLTFGENFFFAAISIGLSIATRLFGLFFFLAIGGLLIAGIHNKVLSVKKAVWTGLLFVFLLLATILVSNPYLFSPGEPAAAVISFTHQGETITQGLDQPDPEGVYQTGINAWWPIMTRDFGSGILLIFLTFSAIFSGLGKWRKGYFYTLLAWLIVVGTYLIGIVMVKSPWYLLPLMIPLYSSAMAIPENMALISHNTKLNPKAVRTIDVIFSILFAALGVIQIVQNLYTQIPYMISL